MENTVRHKRHKRYLKFWMSAWLIVPARESNHFERLTARRAELVALHMPFFCSGKLCSTGPSASRSPPFFLLSDPNSWAKASMRLKIGGRDFSKVCFMFFRARKMHEKRHKKREEEARWASARKTERQWKERMKGKRQETDFFFLTRGMERGRESETEREKARDNKIAVSGSQPAVQTD